MRPIAVLSLLATFGSTHATGILPVLPLSGGTNTLTVQSMSPDGQVVIGNSSGANGFEAFRWTVAGGTVGLGDFAGGGFSSFAHGANFDGSRIAGRGTPDIQRGFLWTTSSGLTRLANLLGGTSTSDRANAISWNGQTLVGQSNSLAYGLRATVWQGTNLGEVLPDVAGGTVFNEALAVNSDGSVVVGWGTGPDGSLAAKWDMGVLNVLGDLPTGSVSARSTAVSGDGLVVYGRGTTANGSTSWRWTQQTGMVQIEPDAVGQLGFNSEVFGTNASGSVAAMRVQNQAAIYVHGIGTLFVENLLAQAGINFAGFDLLDARAVSADGLTIAGNAFVSNVIAGYRVELPPTQSWVSLSGTVNLQNWNPGPGGVPVQLELWDGTNMVDSVTANLRQNGQFGWATSRTGTYTLRVKASHWLAKALSVTLVNGVNASVGTLSLLNGDVNNDNEVGPGDFTLLSGSFGTQFGDAGYLASADLNGDEEVGPADFTILAASFGESGD